MYTRLHVLMRAMIRQASRSVKAKQEEVGGETPFTSGRAGDKPRVNG